MVSCFPVTKKYHLFFGKVQTNEKIRGSAVRSNTTNRVCACVCGHVGQATVAFAVESCSWFV